MANLQGLRRYLVDPNNAEPIRPYKGKSRDNANYGVSARFVDKNGKPIGCGDIAFDIAKILISSGKKPYIIIYDNHGEEIRPKSYQESTGWKNHQVCVCNGIVYDPLIGKGVPIEKHSKQVFGKKLKSSVMYDESETKRLIPEERKIRRPPYMPKLEKIVELFEKTDENFPYSSCIQAARVVHLLTGLEEVGGTKPSHSPFHACNYDPKRDIYIDITAGQFSDSKDKILVFREDFSIFYPSEEHTKIQKEYDSPEMRRTVNKVMRLAKKEPMFKK